jgi:putative RecB family exonuclease
MVLGGRSAESESYVEVDDSRSLGLPAVWSPTSVNTFLKCPLSYWWQYAQGWRSAPTAALAAGSLVHAVLEELLALDPDHRTRERAREIYSAAAAEMQTEMDSRVDLDDLRRRAGTALTSYFELEDPRAVEVVPDGLERSVSATLSGVPMAGSVDRLEFSVGGARVLDYKTGGAKPRYAEAYWRQLMLYARMLDDMGVEVADVALMYLGEPSRLMVRPAPPGVTSRVEDEIVDVAAQRSEFEESGRWPARTGRLCSYCPFRVACPAWSDREVPVPGSAESTAILERSRELIRRTLTVSADARAEPGAGPDADADADVS